MEQADFEEREELLRQQVGAEALEAVDEQVYKDPSVKDLIFQIRNAEEAGRPDEASVLVGKNRDLVDNVRIKLLRASGAIVDLATLEDESEKQREQTISQIRNSLTGEVTQDEMLTAYGLLNEEGKLTKDSIRSPLFRKRTSLAFTSYISAVKSHMDMVDYMQASGDRSTDVDAIAADNIRTKAHNAVSREVAEDLGLDFDVARRLVAKMRDDVIPQGSESESYARSAIRVGQKLSERYGHSAAWLMEDKTKIIFQS